jgi:hypothetical protein
MIACFDRVHLHDLQFSSKSDRFIMQMEDTFRNIGIVSYSLRFSLLCAN